MTNKLTNMTVNEKQQLVKAIRLHLGSRDKAQVFLSCEFPKIIQEGFNFDSEDIILELYFEFDNRYMLGSLISHLNTIFDCDLNLTL